MENLRGILFMILAMAGFALEDLFIKLLFFSMFETFNFLTSVLCNLESFFSNHFTNPGTGDNVTNFVNLLKFFSRSFATCFIKKFPKEIP